MKPIDCKVFEDQLDALIRGELGDEGARLLRLHAAGCEACGALLRVQEELSGSSLAKLEAAVPPELLATLWPGVREELARGAGAPASGGTPPPRRGFRFLVPLLAAASLALLFSSGLLLRELGASRAREAALADEIELRDVGTTPARGGRTLLGGADPLQSLGQEGEITVAELRALLAGLPGSTTVLTSEQADALVRTLRLRVPGVWREARASLAGNRGVRARELLELLDRMDLPPDQAVPTSRIHDLLS